MRSFFRRLQPWQWALQIAMYVGLSLYTTWVDGKLTPIRIAADVLLGSAAAFLFACGVPFAMRIDAKLKRLFSRR